MPAAITTIDPANATDLSDWAFETLAPVVQEWYPKLVAALPSDGFVPPKRVTIRIEDELRNGTPAWTIGSRVELNAKWFRNNLKGEAVGAVIHELVHVVQRQYWRARRKPDAEPMPGWLGRIGLPDPLRDGMFSTPVELDDGIARVPNGPGLGVTIDRDEMKAFCVGMQEVSV